MHNYGLHPPSPSCFGNVAFWHGHPIDLDTHAAGQNVKSAGKAVITVLLLLVSVQD